MMVLISFVVLVLIWNGMDKGMEESLTTNRFLYSEIVKIVPVTAFFTWLAVDSVCSSSTG
jgi:hypothetical protein